MAEDLRTLVADSSSLIEIRQRDLPQSKQAAVFRALTSLVERDQLIFPPQVVEELEWGSGVRGEDQALLWIRSVRARAERSANLGTVKAVLRRAPELIDADSPRDQADPYVVALALDCDSIGGVSVLSDDRRDRPDGRGGIRKLSVATVASIYDIPVTPLAGFIRRFIDPALPWKPN